MSNFYAPPPMTPAPRTSTTALISLISGILSWFLLPFLAAIVAIITGHMAKNEIRGSGGTVGGNGMATAGLVLGYLQIGLFACGCIAVAIMLAFGISIPIIGNFLGQ